MTESREAVTVNILDKPYRILCTTEEGDELRLAAIYLDKKMREIRNSGKVIGVERVAVMAALNIGHDYLSARTDKDENIQTVRHEIQRLLSKVDAAITCQHAGFVKDENEF